MQLQRFCVFAITFSSVFCTYTAEEEGRRPLKESAPRVKEIPHRHLPNLFDSDFEEGLRSALPSRIGRRLPAKTTKKPVTIHLAAKMSCYSVEEIEPLVSASSTTSATTQSAPPEKKAKYEAKGVKKQPAHGLTEEEYRHVVVMGCALGSKEVTAAQIKDGLSELPAELLNKPGARGTLLTQARQRFGDGSGVGEAVFAKYAEIIPATTQGSWLLVELGSDPEIPKNEVTARWWLDHGAKIEDPDSVYKKMIAEPRLHGSLRFLLDQNALGDSFNNTGPNLGNRMFAALRGSTGLPGEFIFLYNYLGKPCNAREDTGFSLLHIATQCGWTDVVEQLVRDGADVTWQETTDVGRGVTPLHIAVMYPEKIEVLKTLLRESARKATPEKPFLVDSVVAKNNNQGLMYFAVLYGNSDAVKLLKQHGSVMQLYKGGATFIVLAAQALCYFKDNTAPTSDHRKVIETLMGYGGVDVNACNKDGIPFWLFCSEPVQKLLAEYGACHFKQNGRSYVLEAALSALQTGDTTTVKTLLERGTPVDLGNLENAAPSLLAILKAMHERGKELSEQACSDLVGLFLEHGASVTKKDKFGLSVWTYVIDNVAELPLQVVKQICTDAHVTEHHTTTFAHFKDAVGSKNQKAKKRVKSYLAHKDLLGITDEDIDKVYTALPEGHASKKLLAAHMQGVPDKESAVESSEVELKHTAAGDAAQNTHSTADNNAQASVSSGQSTAGSSQSSTPPKPKSTQQQSRERYNARKLAEARQKAKPKARERTALQQEEPSKVEDVQSVLSPEKSTAVELVSSSASSSVEQPVVVAQQERSKKEQEEAPVELASPVELPAIEPVIPVVEQSSIVKPAEPVPSLVSSSMPAMPVAEKPSALTHTQVQVSSSLVSSSVACSDDAVQQERAKKEQEDSSAPIEALSITTRRHSLPLPASRTFEETQRIEFVDRISNADLEGVKEMLQADSTYAATRDPYRRIPLVAAVCPQPMKILSRKYPDCSRQEIHNRSQAIIELLLKHKAQVDGGPTEFTPLMHAVRRRDTSAARLLIAHKANLGAVHNGCSVYGYADNVQQKQLIITSALQQKNEAVLTKIAERGAFHDGELFAFAAQDVDTASLKWLIDSGVDCTQSLNDRGDSGLHIAVLSGNIAGTRMLLSGRWLFDGQLCQINPDSINSHQRTPLHEAAHSRDRFVLASARDLCIAGASPEVRDATGKTPIELALEQNNSDFIKVVAPYCTSPLAVISAMADRISLLQSSLAKAGQPLS